MKTLRQPEVELFPYKIKTKKNCKSALAFLKYDEAKSIIPFNNEFIIRILSGSLESNRKDYKSHTFPRLTIKKRDNNYSGLINIKDVIDGTYPENRIVIT